MAVIFENNFEDLGASFDVVDPPVTFVTSPTHHGVYSMQVGMEFPTPFNRVLKILPSSYTTMSIRWYMRVNKLPDANNLDVFLTMYDSASNVVTTLGYYNDGANLEWYYRNWGLGGGNVNNYYVANIAVNEWICVEFFMSPFHQVLYINGVNVRETFDAILYSVHRFVLGSDGTWSTGGVGTGTANFDCIVVADAYIGPETANQTLVYPTAVEEQQTTVGGGATDSAARVRTLRHTTELSPWTA